MARTVAIQGFEGSFHQMAAQQFFGNSIDVITCSTFREVIKNTQSKTSQYGAMAIENSIAGSILPNYTLLEKSSLQIIGEVYLPIKQHLLVNKGVQLDDIKEVHSHHMAILQCMDYLEKHHWKLVETEDTALSAKHIHQRKSKHIAGIAGKLAAQLYNLEILVPNIHTQKNNYTRFLMLQKQTNVTVQANANKASIQFITNHNKGSLSNVLQHIAAHNINLSKLQSMPIAGTQFNYSFYADLEFDHLDNFYKAIEAIKKSTNLLRLFGLYKNGNEQTKP